MEGRPSPRIVVILTGWLLVLVPRMAAADQTAPARKMACAVMPLSGSTHAQAIAELVELQLAESDALRLVNRSEFQTLLDEQVLGSAFDSEGVAGRIQLGRVVKADLLVFLRERHGKGQQKEHRAIEMAVAETQRGLRVVLTAATWQENQVESIAQGLAREVERGRTLAARSDLQVFAVPPFECQDLSLEQSAQRQGFARLVEEFLTSVPGVVVVELSEAQALARESVIAGTTVTRDLPYYLFGSYQTTGTGGQTRFSLEIELRHGHESLRRGGRDEVPQANAAQALHSVVRELLPKAVGDLVPAVPVGVETQVLMDRAEVFRLLGEWDVALPLYESALLLDPDNEQAHQRLFEGHAELARSGGKPQKEWPYFDPAGRVAHGELALEHVSALLRQGRISPELRRRLRAFRGGFSLLGHDRDPGIEPIVQRYRAVLDRHADEVLALLNDPQRVGRLTPADVNDLAQSVSWAAQRLGIGPGREIVIQLVEAVDRLGVDAAALIDMTSTIITGAEGERIYLESLDQLERHASPQLRSVGRICRLLNGVKDQASYDRAMEEITRFVSSEKLDDDVLAKAESLARWRMNLLLSKEGDLPDVRDLMIPRLERLDTQWRLVGAAGQILPARPHVWEWLSCGPDTEIAVLSQGLYRLEGDTELRLVAPIFPAFPTKYHGRRPLATWDGRYVWIFTKKPKQAIVVVDPQRGEVARFDEHEVLYDSDVADGRIAHVRPGLACFFGCLNRRPDPVRTWAVMLEVRVDGDGLAGKRIERIHEARKSKREMPAGAAEDPSIASPPYWAVTVPGGTETGGPWVMVRTELGRPLLLDTGGKETRLAEARWGPDPPAMIDGRYYIPEGRVSRFKQHAYLKCSDHPDRLAKVYVDFGERPTPNSTGSSSGYFVSAVMFQGRLHLLTMHDLNRSPTWSAVDLDSGDTRVLVDQFPKDFRRSWEQLSVSYRYGLLFISNGRAYRAELPPVETWPRLEAKPGPGFGQEPAPAGAVK